MSNGDLEQKVASRWDAGRGNLENFASCFNYIFRGSCCSLKKHLKLSKRKFLLALASTVLVLTNFTIIRKSYTIRKIYHQIMAVQCKL